MATNPATLLTHQGGPDIVTIAGNSSIGAGPVMADARGTPIARPARRRQPYSGAAYIMPAMKPSALLIRTAGTNCDAELAYGLQAAGAEVRIEHLHYLIDHPQVFSKASIIAIPGGFSYGDDIAAGRILANRLRQRLLEPIREAVRRGVLMIGICNGFQVMVKMGLLPAFELDRIGTQSVTLADNTSGRFIDRWVRLEVPAQTRCVWTQGLDSLELPVAHGEGRFVVDRPETLTRLEQGGQVAMRYQAEDDPNGSMGHIAGICDPGGRIFGLMPHPERFVDPTHHPAWTRGGAALLTEEPAGLAILRRGVEAACQATVAT
ncbi:MAG: phosphoribosylformylglycinamidine synthase subunit PurQ [Phycisphaeraceae bacterium]|nr:phosphoribosylformylglycinamidine synthase subunit PurQ [Phycisphaeraceae bacterium]